MSFPRQFIQDVQDRLVLSDVIAKRVKVVRAGREYKACCPFHNEKTPSFTINNEKGFYHCFGCGAHGDAVKFVQEHDNLSFIEALEQLATQVGMQMPEQSPEERQKQIAQKSLYDVLELTTKVFEETLQSNRDAMNYLLGRGLKPETLAHFRLGYAPSNSDILIKRLSDAGFSHQNMIDAGVIRKSTKRAGEHYSFFRDRIMFPVTDLRGRIVAFGGRIMPSIAAQMSSEPPKYINSSDTNLFHKGQILYNLSNARPNVEVDTPFVVVEGYMDVIALHQAGYKTGVAPLGTAMTESQAELLWRVAPPDCRVPILCFDGDNAGRRAASRAMERIMPMLKPDHSARFAFLPDGEDPDTIIQKKGAKGFAEFMVSAAPLSQILWQEELQKRPGTTPEDRAGLKSALLNRIQDIEDNQVRDQYASMLTSKFYDHFRGQKKPYTKRSAYNKGRFEKDRLAPMAIKPQPIKSMEYDFEHYLLAGILNYPVLFDDLEDTLGKLDIKDDDLKRFRQTLFNTLAEHEGLDSKELKDILDKLGCSAIIGALCDESLYRQAVFARPDQRIEDVREGLTFTIARMRKRRKTG